MYIFLTKIYIIQQNNILRRGKILFCNIQRETRYNFLVGGSKIRWGQFFQSASHVFLVNLKVLPIQKMGLCPVKTHFSLKKVGWIFSLLLNFQQKSGQQGSYCHFWKKPITVSYSTDISEKFDRPGRNLLFLDLCPKWTLVVGARFQQIKMVVIMPRCILGRPQKHPHVLLIYP